MPTSKLMLGYHNFSDHFEENKTRFLDLANKGQNPEVLWIGCSDSRVNPELIMGVPPGEIFVMRNIANIIPPSGSGESSHGAVLEYATQVLKVQHIVICGHTDCGGIKALMAEHAPDPDSDIARWLTYAEPIKSTDLGEQNVTRAIEQNVILQYQNLLSYQTVEKPVHDGQLQVHAWIYELATGRIRFYEFDSGSWNYI